ncbi:MAG: 23S rRNA (pseudouridine(1915)-N(3))-methyltransferase RlmH [Bdellovibrio sp.]|nr:23S rRNA (pseudouridine(1915)-N(3))-methyltransferase RlmH [Bdellovibrio sp.]
MKDLHLIIVGKLNESELLKVENDYRKRITKFHFKVHEVKAHGENIISEAKEILTLVNKLFGKIDNVPLYLLAEWGSLPMSSEKFAEKMASILEGSGAACFVLGGASGHAEAIIKTSKESISLSPLTYPHRLARLLFIEQLYRSQCIWTGHPYHK